MNRRIFHLGLAFGTLMLAFCALHAQAPTSEQISLDSDHDGLSDEFENALLAKFLPTFMISDDDCSARPAQFIPGAKVPTVLRDDGTIYGQVFPRKDRPGEVELHYYHLWRKDCGEMGHRLDAEHISALVRVRGAETKAIYWYAAAHEDTICDASQLTRAETIHAEVRGATVWISEGKHASFLSELLCTQGCGGDRCGHMAQLKPAQTINLGELGAPMNGIVWLASPEWPLSDKLQRTDFAESRILRLRKLPNTDISWANPSKRPAQTAISGANAGFGGAATGARATDTALVLANGNTSSALDTASHKTGHALKSSSRNVWHALKKSAQKAGEVLGNSPN